MPTLTLPIAIEKKWTHCFWEFFMLFIVVTLGLCIKKDKIVLHLAVFQINKLFRFTFCKLIL
jgi:hypothetical protein